MTCYEVMTLAIGENQMKLLLCVRLHAHNNHRLAGGQKIIFIVQWRNKFNKFHVESNVMFLGFVCKANIEQLAVAYEKKSIGLVKARY